jgi:hypothetical protein
VARAWQTYLLIHPPTSSVILTATRPHDVAVGAPNSNRLD